MTDKATEKPRCAICNQAFQRPDLISGEVIGKAMARLSSQYPVLNAG